MKSLKIFITISCLYLSFLFSRSIYVFSLFVLSEGSPHELIGALFASEAGIFLFFSICFIVLPLIMLFNKGNWPIFTLIGSIFLFFIQAIYGNSVGHDLMIYSLSSLITASVAFILCILSLLLNKPPQNNR